MDGNEINIIGDFNWSPRLSLAQEVAQLQKGGNNWAPATADFQAVAGNAMLASDFGEFLGAILVQRPHSIRRINVFTHADNHPPEIAFGGDIRMTPTRADVMLNVNAGSNLISLDDQALNFLNTPGSNFSLVKQPLKKFTLKDVRERFTDDASIFFLACHTGSDPAFLQRVADTFRVTAVGFTPAIVYCPRFTTQPPTIDRRHIGLSSCARGDTANFHRLKIMANTGEFISKPPSPPTP
jgi:hypothetical protein